MWWQKVENNPSAYHLVSRQVKCDGGHHGVLGAIRSKIYIEQDG